MTDAMFHVKHRVDDAQSFAEATRADDETISALETFRRRLELENAKLNLVGPSAMASFWSRHAYDSAQLMHVSRDATIYADLGSGAGFPGVVLAILLKPRAGSHVHLVESQAKRCRFLQGLVDELDLPATVHNRRAEDFDPAPLVDVVTARACAPLVRLLGYAWPFMRGGAPGLFLKGRSVEAEISEARGSWRFDADLIPSLSDPEGRVVRVEGLARVRSARRA